MESLLRIIVPLIAFLAAFAPAPVAAQDQGASQEAQGPNLPVTTQTAEEMIEAERQSLRPRGLLRRCLPGKAGEIVVCAEDDDENRVPSSTDQGVNTDTGVPRTPDLFELPEGGVIVARGCFIPPCPRPMPPLIDLKAIPEAPPGSDAARYAEQ